MKNYTTKTILFASLIAIAVITPTAFAVNHITEEYLVEEYDKVFPDTDVTRDDKIAVMDNMLNTEPMKIPANEKRDQMIEKVSALMEKRDSLVDNPKAQEAIDKQVHGMKFAMAKLGLTLQEDYDAQNEWYDLAHQYSDENAHEIPKPEKKFEVIPEADAAGNWSVTHKLDHKCGPAMCSNSWVDTGVNTGEYSHISVVIDTVAWPYSINSWHTAGNSSWSVISATSQGWASLVSGSSTVLNVYKSVNWVFYPYESETWSLLSDEGTLSEDDVYYSTARINT